jgi:hypothetical protein
MSARGTLLRFNPADRIIDLNALNPYTVRVLCFYWSMYLKVDDSRQENLVEFWWS